MGGGEGIVHGIEALQRGGRGSKILKIVLRNLWMVTYWGFTIISRLLGKVLLGCFQNILRMQIKNVKKQKLRILIKVKSCKFIKRPDKCYFIVINLVLMGYYLSMPHNWTWSFTTLKVKHYKKKIIIQNLNSKL